MDPLSSTPQPIHQMVPVLMFLSFILLALLLVLAGLVNWFAKRPLLNGAYWALLLLVLSMAALLGLSLFHPKVTLYGSRMLGQGMAALLPAAALSLFLGRRFKRKRNSVPPAA